MDAEDQLTDTRSRTYTTRPSPPPASVPAFHPLLSAFDRGPWLGPSSSPGRLSAV